MSKEGKAFHCSFCGKSQHEVKKLIAGPSVYVCDECVALCTDIIKEEEQAAPKEAKKDKLPTPGEIKSELNLKSRPKIVLPLKLSSSKNGLFVGTEDKTISVWEFRQ